MQAIYTHEAPEAIGAYSQAVKHGNTVYLSGQIPLDPDTKNLVSDDISKQIHQVFNNLLAVTKACGGTLQDMIKLNIYLIDLNHFDLLNKIMMEYFVTPYPARAVIEVKRLPKDSLIEIDGIMILNS